MPEPKELLDIDHQKKALIELLEDLTYEELKILYESLNAKNRMD